MAINHCVEVDAYKYGDAPERKRLGTSRAATTGSKTSQCEVLQSCEPEFNYTGCKHHLPITFYK